MLTIYTVAGGAWFRDTLNGVAAFFNSNAGDALLAMATAVSVIVGIVSYIRTRNILELAKWAGFYVLVISVLIGIKKEVQVVDLSEPAAIYQVDNVPAGLAVPAALITQVGAGLAKAYDTIFARPDALTYSKTGMLFGAQLAARATDFRFSEPDIQRMFSDYVHNCVVGDIMLNHKYTFGDLMNAADPYEVIFRQPSPLRGLYDKNRNFLTCEQASAKMNMDSGDISGANTAPYLQQVLRTMHGFTNQVFGPTNGAGTALFTEMLGDSYRYFHGTSSTAADIIRKNVVMNGLRSGLDSFAAANGDTAGMLNAATQTSMAKMRLSQATSASIASSTLPVMHSVLLGMTLALFPVMIVLAVVSSLSFTILKGYIYTIAYLQMWPILFSILNHAMNFYLQGRLGGTPVTLATFDQVQNTYSDIGTTAGWLALSIPFIAWGMVKGLGQVVSQAGNYLGQTMQSSSTQSSSQAVDGNWSFNNMQTDNVQGNKWDTNYGHREGHMTTQLRNGATKTLTSSGDTIMETSGGMSKLATHINWANSTMTGMNTSQREQLAQSEQAMSGYQHSRDSSWSQLQQFAAQHGNSDNVTKAGDSGVASNVTLAMNKMKSLVESHAKANNISESQSYNELMDKSSRGTVSAGIKGSAGTPKWIKSGFGVGVDVHASAEASGSTGSSHGTRQEHGQTNDSRHDKNAQTVADFRDARDVVTSHASKLSASHSDGSTASHVGQFAANLQDADREFNSWQSSQTRAREYSEMATWAQDHRSQIDQNLDQQFANYVMEKAPAQAETILSNTGSASIAAEQEKLAQAFIQERVLPQLEATYQANKDAVGQNMADVPAGERASLQGQFETNSAAVKQKSQQAGVRYDAGERVVSQLDTVDKQVAGNKSKVDSGQEYIDQERDSLKSNHEVARQNQEKGMDNESAKQKSLAGFDNDEMTKMAQDAQNKGATYYGKE